MIKCAGPHENKIIEFLADGPAMPKVKWRPFSGAPHAMELKLRPGKPEDAEICGTICYNAFRTISEAHGFVPDFPAPEVAIEVLRRMLANPKFYSVVAEIDGRI